VVVAPVTANSPATDKADATWVETAGLANPSCVSFESVNVGPLTTKFYGSTEPDERLIGLRRPS